MAAPALPDDLAKQAAEAYRLHGSQNAAAAALDISRTTLQGRLHTAARRGLMGTEPVLPGFQIKSVASKQGDAWVKQTAEHGEVFETPAGHAVKGVSALVDPEGRIVQQWIKTREERGAVALDALKAAFEAYRPAGLVTPPAHTNDDLLTVYPIADLHLGMFSWAKETGADYDIDIASTLLRSSMNSLVSRSAAAKHAVVLDLGANVGATARQLVDFALMGAGMARAILQVERPRVALLNIGVEEIKGLAAETLEIDTADVTEASRFSDDLEADSLDLVELVMAMEEKFDIKIDESELEDIETVGQVMDIVETYRELASGRDLIFARHKCDLALEFWKCALERPCLKRALDKGLFCNRVANVLGTERFTHLVLLSNGKTLKVSEDERLCFLY